VDRTNVEHPLYINKINTPSNPSFTHPNPLHIPINPLPILINLNQLNPISIDHNLINHYLIPLLKLLQLHSINQRGSMDVDNRLTRFSLSLTLSNLKVINRHKDMDTQPHRHPLFPFKIRSITPTPKDMGKHQDKGSQVFPLPTSIPILIPKYPKTRGEVQCPQSSLSVSTLYRVKIHLVGPLVLLDINSRSQFPIYQ
jgi:hypothetical protein